MMIEDRQDILPEKRVWGFWATAGFGFLIGLATTVAGVIGFIVYVLISPYQLTIPFPRWKP